MTMYGSMHDINEEQRGLSNVMWSVSHYYVNSWFHYTNDTCSCTSYTYIYYNPSIVEYLGYRKKKNFITLNLLSWSKGICDSQFLTRLVKCRVPRSLDVFKVLRHEAEKKEHQKVKKHLSLAGEAYWFLFRARLLSRPERLLIWHLEVESSVTVLAFKTTAQSFSAQRWYGHLEIQSNLFSYQVILVWKFNGIERSALLSVQPYLKRLPFDSTRNKSAGYFVLWNFQFNCLKYSKIFKILYRTACVYGWHNEVPDFWC